MHLGNESVRYRWLTLNSPSVTTLITFSARFPPPPSSSRTETNDRNVAR